MGKPKARYCCRAYESKWRIWDRKMNKWWGNSFSVFPQTLIDELNGQKRPDIITELSRRK